ncbi:amidohydrolase family protein [Roseobacter sp. YSTF-M11]|uniref:Amidohydrolase family protein n=1 Tax=Roseobacter insulae TaxID=2859783 RepID=A0A9X1FXY9_9RHOB|nr:amidohydrolase family protein [Roseobacter insulae]MBW4709746.1 amidohydrolase family protein [Roseobacter insulae]
MRLIDAHHHFWDPDRNYHPWLRDAPMIPFRYGDYSAIRGRFMAAEYDAAAGGWDVVASVTMEGEWDPADPTGEALWMQGVADATGRPAAHVAQAWLDRDDLSAVLDAIAPLPIVKSVRHKPRANAAPGGAPGGMNDAAYRRGFKKLAKAGLMFDLQAPWWHLSEVPALADLAPEVPIILNHTGLPSDRSAEGLAGWRAAMEAIARLPQVVVKISGLGLPDRPWCLEDNREIIRRTIDIFGPDRAMFASNFPVDGLCGSFDTIFSGFDIATQDYGEPARDALFFGTAARIYGIGMMPNDNRRRNT